jgi:nucleotide-binding universal stress UspA family protein
MSYTTVLVGTDGSESAMKAVARAADVAAARNASLIVVCAFHPMSAREQALITPATGDATARVTGTRAAEAALDLGVEHARQAGAPQVEGRLVEGDAVEALLSVAQERSAGLIVVGNRGVNTLSGRLLGSVPSDVVQRAPCDVLIVHTTSGRRR